MILTLPDAPEEEIGGKGVGLARLMRLGLPVPAALVVPVSDRGRLEDPEGLVRSLGERLAVRSSAVGEDGTDRSAAGQFMSLMGVRPSDVPGAVGRVFRSAGSDRARAYRGNGSVDMAVIVQREVPATKAGVAFSRDPLTGSDDVVVECVFGHGERLVSGEVNADRYRVGRDGTVRARLLKGPPHQLLRSLRDDEAREVAELTRSAEEGFGQPIDVEFCFDAGGVWLVQARPITALRSG